MTFAKDCFYAVADAGSFTESSGKTNKSWIVKRFESEAQRDRFVNWYNKPGSGRGAYFAATYQELHDNNWRGHLPPEMLDICTEFAA